jgi:beta-ribofuranosylaminobenzene 5'-phosphate synthase
MSSHPQTIVPTDTDRPGGSLVEVAAPARLHMGFIDPAGIAGRRFGSVGLAVDRPTTRVRVSGGEGLRVEGPETERVSRYVRKLLTRAGCREALSVTVVSAMPSHAGLGSGTQLALALGAAISRWSGTAIRGIDVATLLERGGRSGIGVGAFEQGGFLVDGGKGPDGAPPPLIARCDVPEHWRVLLVFDTGHRGLSGEREREAFRVLARRSPPDAQSLAALVLLGMLPAAVEGDLQAVGAAVTELQERIGDHFAPVQGGRFASPAVTQTLAWLRSQGVAGVGQSSWGPTGFGLCESQQQAERLVDGLAALRATGSTLRFQIARPRNVPATVRASDHGVYQTH